MSIKATLRSPGSGEIVVRGVAGGRWAEPVGGEEVSVGSDLWAVPGLVDAHAHIAAAELDFMPGNLEEAMERAREALNAGVTLILDKGWTDSTAIEVIDRIPSAERPDIEAAASIVASVDGYMSGFGRQIDPVALSQVVSEEAEAGRGWVKLIGDWPRTGRGPVANFTVAELTTAVEVAHSRGSRVAIHTMARDVPSTAVQAGVDSIEHGLFLTEADIADLGRRSGHWVPTILRVEATIAQLGEASSGGKLLAEGLDRLRTLIPIAVEAGVRVLTGTDLVGTPADVAAEAQRLSDFGLSGPQVVAAATTEGFAGTGRSHAFDLGAPADAVFFEVDPADDPKVLAHPRHVMRLGRLL